MKCTSPVYHPHSHPESSFVPSATLLVCHLATWGRALLKSYHIPRVITQSGATGSSCPSPQRPWPFFKPDFPSWPSPEPISPCHTVQGTAVKFPSLKASSGTGSASRVGLDTKKEVSRVCFIINKEKTTRTTSPSSINQHWSESKQRQTKMELSSLQRRKAPDVMSLARRVCLKCLVQWPLEINQKPFKI